MPTTDAEVTLLNRILDEIKGLREDFRSLETRHGDLAGRVIKLEEDRSTRERAAQVRLALVCTFGVMVVGAVANLYSTLNATANQLALINNYGTAYGRGVQTTIDDRLRKIEGRR